MLLFVMAVLLCSGRLQSGPRDMAGDNEKYSTNPSDVIELPVCDRQACRAPLSSSCLIQPVPTPPESTRLFLDHVPCEVIDRQAHEKVDRKWSIFLWVFGFTSDHSRPTLQWSVRKGMWLMRQEPPPYCPKPSQNRIWCDLSGYSFSSLSTKRFIPAQIIPQLRQSWNLHLTTGFEMI